MSETAAIDALAMLRGRFSIKEIALETGASEWDVVDILVKSGAIRRRKAAQT